MLLQLLCEVGLVLSSSMSDAVQEVPPPGPTCRADFRKSHRDGGSSQDDRRRERG